MSAIDIERIGRWTLRRFEYDGAPLYAEKLDGTWIEINDDGDLEIDYIPEEERRVYVPAALIARLLDDARARGVTK